jgi:hypothetical protein
MLRRFLNFLVSQNVVGFVKEVGKQVLIGLIVTLLMWLITNKFGG